MSVNTDAMNRAKAVNTLARRLGLTVSKRDDDTVALLDGDRFAFIGTPDAGHAWLMAQSAMQTNRCPNGHEITEANTRRQQRIKGGTGECLECYRDTCRERSRRRYQEHSEVIDRVRHLRAQAKRVGLTTKKKHGVDLIELLDGERQVFAGNLALAEAWMAENAAPRRRSGPLPDDIPAVWRPYIHMLVEEMRAAKRSPATIETRVGRLTRFARDNPDSHPLTVTRAELVKYMADNPGWTPEYAHSVRTSLRVFFSLLEDLELRPNDPARRLPRIQIPRAVPRPCPDGAIRATLADEVTDPRARLAIRIGAETGLRRMEIASLRRDDVEGCGRDYRVRVRRGKGGHERLVPISDALAAELLDGEGAFVFPSPPWGHLTPARLGEIVAEALPGNWTAHTLRHRFATAAYQATGDLRAVQILLGHASPATTAIYTQVADESLRRAAMTTVLDS